MQIKNKPINPTIASQTSMMTISYQTDHTRVVPRRKGYPFPVLPDLPKPYQARRPSVDKLPVPMQKTLPDGTRERDPKFFPALYQRILLPFRCFRCCYYVDVRLFPFEEIRRKTKDMSWDCFYTRSHTCGFCYEGVL